MLTRTALLIIVSVVVGAPFHSGLAATLWAVVVADTGDVAAGQAITTGRNHVVEWVRRFQSGLKERGVDSKVAVLDGVRFNTNELRKVINDDMRQVSQKDAIFFYYIGHGKNVIGTSYPRLAINDENGADEGLSFKRVVDVLKSRHANLLFAMAEACNGIAGKTEPELTALGEFGREYMDLFFGAGEDIIITSVSPGELANADKDVGGIYTNIFFNLFMRELEEAAREGRPATWDRILSPASQPILAHGVHQTPQIWVDK